MSDRARAPPHSNGASRPTRGGGGLAASSNSASSSNNGNSSSNNSSNHRPNNLFRSHFIRRPATSSSNPAENMRADVEMQQDEDTSEIVVRDQHGEIEIENPPTPVMDDEEELQAHEYRQETEREKQRLAEAIRHHQISHSSMADQPDALLEAVRESLRNKVTGLADDNWMFEPEEQTRG